MVIAGSCRGLLPLMLFKQQSVSKSDSGSGFTGDRIV